jgi:peptide/nickel transport system ATP-binding protein
MYAGRIVELGPTAELFANASHPYTRRLVQAIPHLSGRRDLVGIPGRAPSPGARPHGCAFAPRCTFVMDACRADEPRLRKLAPNLWVKCIRAEEVRASAVSRSGRLEEHIAQGAISDAVLSLDHVFAGYGSATVVHDINLQLAPHECLALVGESGSGKTTLARSIAGLHRDRSGLISLRGQPLADAARSRTREARQSIQYVFQNPYGSLNPRKTIGQIVRQPLGVFGAATGAEADKRVEEMLDRVSLASSYVDRYPDQLSGGERQRVAIARALVVSPAVLVCDEVTSALDVSVQAAIVELLAELQRELGLAMLFVTHNLPLVRSIAQRVAVMSAGRIVELGAVEHVLHAPTDDYTKALLADTPSLETAIA